MSDSGELWRRTSWEPLLGALPGTWLEDAATTPDVLAYRDQTLLYCGAVCGGHERLVAMGIRYDGETPTFGQVKLAVDVGPAGAFDSDHVFDPAGVAIGDRVFLYYSTVGAAPDSIGLATSVDGYRFEKHPHPVLIGRAPEVAIRQGKFHLLYVLEAPRGGYVIHLAVSDDGCRFRPAGPAPVLDVGAPGTWDSFSVLTGRVFEYGDMYDMVYAGDAREKDLPRAFGLARSTDLVHWERYRHNPVFRCGPPSAWDDGAIWFGTVFVRSGILDMWYEGGSQTAVQASPPMLTRVGLATLEAAEFEQRIADW
jgi:hypothetical protein